MKEREVSDVVDDIRRLRLTLTADLAAAAAAIDEGEPAVARDILAADRLEVRQIASRHSDPSRRATANPRRRRALLALPAIPLIGAMAITGAAALSIHNAAGSKSASLAGHATRHHAVADPHQTAATTLQQLERAVSGDTPESQVVAVADQLHSELTAIIAASPGSAQRMTEVQRLLAVEQRVLEGRPGPGEAIALAASRRLTHLLSLVELPRPAASPSATATPDPSASPTKSPTKSPAIVITSPPHSTSPTTSTSSPSPKPSPSHSKHHHGRLPPLLAPSLFGSRV